MQPVPCRSPWRQEARGSRRGLTQGALAANGRAGKRNDRIWLLGDGAKIQGKANLPLHCSSVVLDTTAPDADIFGYQHLRHVVDMAYHQRHGGGTVCLSQGWRHGQNQRGEQKQGFDVHGALLDDIYDGSVNVIWIPL